MKISYGFVFYFEILMIALTILLILLYFRPIRKLIFGIADRYKIGEGPIYNTIFWIIFAVIAIILIDSVLTYLAIRETLEIGTFFITQIAKICLQTILILLRLTNMTTTLSFTKSSESTIWLREISCSLVQPFLSCSYSRTSCQGSEKSTITNKLMT